MKFSAYDMDLESYPLHCAQHSKGAWWYKNCKDGQATGEYKDEEYTGDSGIKWYSARGKNQSFRYMEMKIQKRN